MAVTLAPLQARASEPGITEAQQLLVAAQDGRLSVRTGAVSMAEVLRAIGNATDLRVTIKGDLGKVRPQAFQGLAVEEGLRRLVGDRHPLVMLYDPHPDRSETRVLKEVRVYGEAREEQGVEQEQLTVRAPAQSVRPRPVEADTPAARYLYGADSAGRREAAKQLKENPDDAMPALTAALDDPEGEVRLRALRTLPALQGDDALAHLSRVARTDPDPELRQAAIYMLAAFDTDDVRRVLQATLGDSDERVRQAAAQTLSLLRAR